MQWIFSLFQVRPKMVLSNAHPIIIISSSPRHVLCTSQCVFKVSICESFWHLFAILVEICFFDPCMQLPSIKRFLASLPPPLSTLWLFRPDSPRGPSAQFVCIKDVIRFCFFAEKWNLVDHHLHNLSIFLNRQYASHMSSNSSPHINSRFMIKCSLINHETTTTIPHHHLFFFFPLDNQFTKSTIPRPNTL